MELQVADGGSNSVRAKTQRSLTDLPSGYGSCELEFDGIDVETPTHSTRLRGAAHGDEHATQSFV